MKIATAVKNLSVLTGVILSCSGVSAAPISFAEDTADGVDNALLRAFNKAVETVSPGTSASLSAQTISAAVLNTSLRNGQLSVTFDDEKVREVLNNAGITSWSGLEDPVLLWFTNVADGKVINSPDAVDAVRSFCQAAEKNGIRVMFPVMDLDDIQQVNSQTILSHNDEGLKKASARYDARYYIAGAVNREANGEYEFKVNVYDAEGKTLGSAQRKGSVQESSELLAKDVAGVFMSTLSTAQNGSTQEAPNGLDAPSEVIATDSLTPGAYQGFVRIMVSGISNIQDYKAIQGALITFGYEASTKIRAYTPEGAIIDVPTEASPSILDGTLAHSGEFTKEGEWRYHWNRSVGKASTGRDGIGAATPDRVISAPEVVKPVNKTGDENRTQSSSSAASVNNAAEVSAVSD